MKNLTLIAVVLFIIACENQGKKVVEEKPAEESVVKNVTIKGILYSANDSIPLVNALVFLPGTTTGTISAGDGSFQISIPEGSNKLLFAMDGYEKSESEISPDKENKIYLILKSD